MLKNKTFLAVIPARAGSKRLVGKNTRMICGKPLIEWTIGSAKKSKYIDKIVVTSDDINALTIADSMSVQRILRPGYLATDVSDTFDVIAHVIEELDTNYDFIILLQPTSPLRTAEHIDSAMEFLFSKNAKAIVSISEMDHSPQWANILPPDGSMDGFINESVKGKRSQELEPFFRINGAIYISDLKFYLKHRSFIFDSCYGFKMPTEDSIDIDTISDFVCAEALLKSKYPFE